MESVRRAPGSEQPLLVTGGRTALLSQRRIGPARYRQPGGIEIETTRNRTPRIRRPSGPARALLLAGWLVLAVGLAADAEAEGPRRLRLESVRIEPAGGQEEVLVRRHLPLRAGQAVDPDVLMEAQRYLEALGSFSLIEMYTERGSERGAIVLVIEAELDRSLRFETGVGNEPLRGWYLTFPGVRKSSPFGRGGRFRAGLHSGLRTSGAFGELVVPSIRRDDIDLLLEAELRSDEWEFTYDSLRYDQYIDRFVLRAGLRQRAFDTLSMTLWAGVSTADPDGTLEGAEGNDNLEAAEIMPAADGNDHYADLSFEVLWDRRDRFRAWQDGYWAGLRLQGSVENDGPAFYAAELDYRVARPLWRHHAIAFRTHAAWNSEETPYHLREVVGGPRSLRGFDSAALSGPLGARGLWLTSLELRLAVAGDDPRRPRVLSTLFVDAGQHWNASGSRNDPVASIGYGLQFSIPWLQVLNFEVGYPLSEGRDDPVMTHISLGRSF